MGRGLMFGVAALTVISAAWHVMNGIWLMTGVFFSGTMLDFEAERRQVDASEFFKLFTDKNPDIKWVPTVVAIVHFACAAAPLLILLATFCRSKAIAILSGIFLIFVALWSGVDIVLYFLSGSVGWHCEWWHYAFGGADILIAIIACAVCFSQCGKMKKKPILPQQQQDQQPLGYGALANEVKTHDQKPREVIAPPNSTSVI